MTLQRRGAPDIENLSAARINAETGDQEDVVRYRMHLGRTDYLGIKCGSCGSLHTYGYVGNAFCAGCGAHDQDGG